MHWSAPWTGRRRIRKSRVTPEIATLLVGQRNRQQPVLVLMEEKKLRMEIKKKVRFFPL